MKLRPPSWGFVYLASVVTGCAVFFVLMTGRFWFDDRNAATRQRHQAAYLVSLAAKSAGAQRWRWLNEALPTYFELADSARVLDILDQLDGTGVEPQLHPRWMLVPNAVWGAGLSGDRWTLGTQPALFLARNPGSADARLVLQWRAPAGARARFRSGRGKWQPAPVVRAADGSSALELELPLPASSGFELISVAAETPFSPKGDARQLGLHLELVEVRP